MDWLVSYAALTAVFVVTPGASTALVLRNAMAGGRRAGLETASGIALGNGTYAAAAGLGLSTVLLTVPGALPAIRALGGCYLLWLGGAGIVRASRRAFAGDESTASPRASQQASPARSSVERQPFVEGLVTNLLNPAIPLFYATYVPQFLSANVSFWPRFGALAVVHVLMALSMHSFYAVTAGTASTLLMRPRARLVVDITAGLALVALALQLLRA